MDINRKKELAKNLKKKFLIQVEYEFDEDSQGFKRQINFLEDSEALATIEIINLIRSNINRLRSTIGKEVDDNIVTMMSNILDNKKMEDMLKNSNSIFGEDGFMNAEIREDK